MARPARPLVEGDGADAARELPHHDHDRHRDQQDDERHRRILHHHHGEQADKGEQIAAESADQQIEDLGCGRRAG